MIVTIVNMKVKTQYIDEFIQACEKNHHASIKEPGNLRFDFIQRHDEPNQFVFYEAYKSEQDIKQHKLTEHYKSWRQTVEPMMAEARQAVVHKGLLL